ncbi:MAG: ECF transporter S component [Aerococcaceae bacterium]|nr:ECF transporter S component [Aerococcaceae bacterium]
MNYHDIFWKVKHQAFYITVIAMISAVAIVGRSVFTFLPNVKPITVIFLMVTVIFGLVSGLLVMFVTIVATSIQHGFGIWVAHQLIAYAILLGITRALWRRTSLTHPQKFPFIIWCGIVGYLYGILMTIAHAVTVQLANPFPYYLNGLWFDTYHAFGNIGFAIILVPVLTPILTKIRTQLLARSA